METPTAQRLLELSDLNMAESFREFARRSRGEIREEGALLFVSGSHPFPRGVVTGAIRTFPGLAAAEVLERAEDFFAERDRRFWVLAAAHADLDLEAAARGREYRLIVDLAGMVLDHRLDDGAALDTDLRWVEDEAGVRAFAGITGEAFGDPSLQAPTFTDLSSLSAPHIATVVAYLDGEPVSARAVVVSHGVALVGFIGTKVAARGRGLGEAVTRAVTNRGFDLGARLASLQASPEGDAIYRRLGYKEITRYRLWLAPAPI